MNRIGTVRRLHAGHYLLAGVLVLWLAISTVTSVGIPVLPGVWLKFWQPDAVSADQAELSDQPTSYGPWAFGEAEDAAWTLEDVGNNAMAIEGWGDALFTWTLWKRQDDGDPEQDQWVYGRKAWVEPETRGKAPDPVISKMYFRATPTAKTLHSVREVLRTRSDGEGFSRNLMVPGEAGIGFERGPFSRASGGQGASYTVHFTVDQGVRPRFQNEQGFAVRSFWQRTRSCSSVGVSEECEG